MASRCRCAGPRSRCRRISLKARHGAGTKEFGHFLSLACGSLAELETQLLLSGELGYAKPEETTPAGAEIVEMQKMFAAIRRKLETRAVVSD